MVDSLAKVAVHPNGFGIPRYYPGDELRGKTGGVPEVKAEGSDEVWKGAPLDSGRICAFKASGLLWFPKKGVIQKLYEALKDPKNHPDLLAGVEQSKDVYSLPTGEGPVVHHVYNLQAGDKFQYLSEMTAYKVIQGYIFVQRSMENVAAWVAPEDLFPDKRPDLLKDFQGQIQLLEVANGTVLVMEFSSVMAGISVSCRTAADSAWIPNIVGGDRAVKQRIETRLENLYNLAQTSNVQ